MKSLLLILSIFLVLEQVSTETGDVWDILEQSTHIQKMPGDQLPFFMQGPDVRVVYYFKKGDFF